MKKDDAVLSVDFKKEYSTLDDEVKSTKRVCISLNAIQDGLIKEVGANRLAILLAIVSHMNEEGKSFPSQERIAQLTGQGRATVQRNLDALCETVFNGQRLLTKELVGDKRKRTVYTFNQGMITGTDETDEAKFEANVIEPMNSRDFAVFFADLYKETFGQGYTINFGRDLGIIKKKLLPNYDEETLKGIIVVAITMYKDKWANDDYPYPTISMLGSWLANKAFAIYSVEREKALKQIERQQTAIEQDDSDKFLDMFGEDE